MAYKPHALVAFGGKLNGTLGQGQSEIWQCTLRVSEAPVFDLGVNVSVPAVSNPLTDPAAFMNWAAPNLMTQFRQSTWNSTPGVGMHSAATLEWLKVNNVGTRADGTFGYTDPITNEFLWNQTNGGQGTQTGQAWHTTAAGSLRTNALNKGPGSHGRMYLPINLPAQSSPQLSGAWTSALAALYAAFVRTFKCDGNGAYPHPVTPCIHSPGGKTNGHQGVFYPIDYVQVGSRMDTIRRRLDALTETYSAKVNI